MTPESSRPSVVAAIAAALAVVGTAAVATSVGGSSDAGTMASLAGQIQAQADATRAAVALANDLWMPRVAGLGLGLSAGLLAGGVVTYLKWGGSQ